MSEHLDEHPRDYDLSYAEAIEVGRDLITSGDGDNLEYNRGVVNLIADLFATHDMDSSTRMIEVAREMGVRFE
jgi:hypothetical protein